MGESGEALGQCDRAVRIGGSGCACIGLVVSNGAAYGQREDRHHQSEYPSIPHRSVHRRHSLIFMFIFVKRPRAGKPPAYKCVTPGH